MKRDRILAAAAVLAAASWLASTSVFTQGGSETSAQLRAAMHRETVQGDLNGAITEYRRIADGNADRAVKVRALMRLGLAYEKASNDSAVAVYERIVREYGDVADATRIARARLAALNAGTVSAGRGATQPVPRVTVRLAWGEGAVTSWNSVSADGRWLTFVELSTLNVMLRDMETGTSRAVTSDADGKTSVVWDHSISPDGRWLAYAYVRIGQKDGTVHQGQTELRVMRIDGSDRRTLATWDDRHSINGFAWSPDQRHLVVGTSIYGGTKQAVMFSLEDGRQRVLLDDSVRAFYGFRFSPDGQRLLVNFQRKFQTSETDVSVLDLGERLEVLSERVLLGEDWPEHAFGWSPDGRHVVFQSTRNGSLAVWQLPVANGRAAGSATLVRPLDSRTLFGALTLDGTLIYSQSTRQRNAMVGKLNAAAGRVTDVQRATARLEDVTAALGWSPDARWFAYGRPDETVVLRDEETGAERDLKLPFTMVRRINWHPDSRALIVSGVADDVNGIHQVRLDDASVRLLMRSPDNPPMAGGFLGPDGTSLYFTSPWQRISVRSTATAQPKVLIEKEQEAFWHSSVSPDGRTLAAGQPSTLWLVPTEGGEPRAVFRVPDGGSLRGVSWLPGGEGLLLMVRSGAEGHPFKLLKYQVAGGTTSPVDVPAPFGQPGVEIGGLHVHPDALRIAYTPIRVRNEIWRLENFLPTK